jgi:hypothetical protein
MAGPSTTRLDGHNVVESQLLGLVNESEDLIVEVDPEGSDGDVAVLSTGQGVEALLQACRVVG